MEINKKELKRGEISHNFNERKTKKKFYFSNSIFKLNTTYPVRSPLKKLLSFEQLTFFLFYSRATHFIVTLEYIKM